MECSAKPPSGTWGRVADGKKAPLLMCALVALSGMLFLCGLDHALLIPDEARYAEISRQMLAEGRFLTPVLHGETYWQKPPLLYWLIMACYQVFGVHDWSARLVPCLAGTITVAITAAWGWRVLGFWTGFISGAMLALSGRFLYLAGMLTMDSLLCACVLAGLASGHLALLDFAKQRRWIILSATACSLGILAKGPVAIVLIAVPLIGYKVLRWRREGTGSNPAPWKVRYVFLYVVIVGLLSGPWFVYMAWADPDAAREFFWLHHIRRYAAPLDHQKPVWFFLPSLLLGMLPWTLLLLPAVPYLMRTCVRARRRRPEALFVFVLCFAWCLLFFSLSGCKRPGYILPAFPLLSLMLGTYVVHGSPWRTWLRRPAPSSGHTLAYAAGLGGMFLILALGQRLWIPRHHDQHALRRQVASAGIIAGPPASGEYEQEAHQPVFADAGCLDAVCFYSRRSDIEVCVPGKWEKLAHCVRSHGEVLFFASRNTLSDLQRALPKGVKIEERGQEENHFVAVFLRRG